MLTLNIQPINRQDDKILFTHGFVSNSTMTDYQEVTLAIRVNEDKKSVNYALVKVHPKERFERKKGIEYAKAKLEAEPKALEMSNCGMAKSYLSYMADHKILAFDFDPKDIDLRYTSTVEIINYVRNVLRVIPRHVILEQRAQQRNMPNYGSFLTDELE